MLTQVAGIAHENSTFQRVHVMCPDTDKMAAATLPRWQLASSMQHLILPAHHLRRPVCSCRAIAASSVMSGVAVIMGVGLWYTEAVAVHLFRQPDVVAKVASCPVS